MSSFLDHGSAHIFLLAIGAGLGIRVVMHFVDKSRIKDEVESSGGRIISIRWNPFGRGWFLEKNERHYFVVNTDRSGATVPQLVRPASSQGSIGPMYLGAKSARPRFIPRHPTKCGFGVNAEWRACPNCGMTTEFA